MTAITLNLLAEEQLAELANARDPVKGAVAIGVGLLMVTVLTGSALYVGASQKKADANLLKARYDALVVAETAGAADLISGGRLQLGLSRGSPEQVIDGWRYFGYQPTEGETDADLARRHTELLLDVLKGEGFAKPNPRPMFANPPGLLRVEPYSEGLRERIWWGSSSNATSVWAAQHGMNLQSSTLKDDETGEPLHVQQRKQIEAFREAWA